MNKQTRVVVAMSGGVDSSVAAALLVGQGYEVIGVMLRLWSESGQETHNRCCTPDAVALARRVAAKLEIPFYAIDAKKVFRKEVVEYFIDGYTNGVTPNPCLVCNRRIRWGFLFDKAVSLGARYLATGHYARLDHNKHGYISLLRAIDRAKDQSYVLHMLNQAQLGHTILPLGGITKSQVRQIARDFDLPVSERNESQDLCFLGNGSYREFLLRNASYLDKPGLIIKGDGAYLGVHQGQAFYTIGQRKGLGISAPHPLYVLEKDIRTNIIIVGQKEELGKVELKAESVNWISGEPPKTPFHAQIKIRYKSNAVRGFVTPHDATRFHIGFEKPLRDITPGQAAVLYADDRCLGGGIIK
jgi:tRNA-specific 2-thiouridylase